MIRAFGQFSILFGAIVCFSWSEAADDPKKVDVKDVKDIKDIKETTKPAVPVQWIAVTKLAAKVTKVESEKDGPSVTVEIGFSGGGGGGGKGKGKFGGAPMRRTKEVTYKFAGEPEVRTNEMPRKGVGANGVPLQYTPEELRALKGNPKFPGWAKAFADLRVGAEVELQMVRDPKSKSTDPDDLLILYAMIVKDAPKSIDEPNKERKKDNN